MSSNQDKLFAQSTIPNPDSKSSSIDGEKTAKDITASLTPSILDKQDPSSSSKQKSESDLQSYSNTKISEPTSKNISSYQESSDMALPVQISHRQQAMMLISQVLNKLPRKILTEDNFTLWSSFIRTELKSLFLADYLKSDTLKTEDSQLDDEVCRACITSWMLGTMDDVNRSRFEPKITSYTDDGPETDNLPAKLWKAVNSHHLGRSEELRLLLERSLNMIVQPLNQPLLTHIEIFQTAVTKYKTAGGKMSDKDLGRELLISLNNSYFQDAKELAILGVKEYDKVVTELKKRLDAVAMLTKNRMKQKDTFFVILEAFKKDC
jgi:hypothetical protein